MKCIITLLLTFCLLIFNQINFAQTKSSTLHLKHYGTQEGLSQIAVSDILMDSEGYMWYCTWKGLFRYDTYAMKAFFLDEKDERGIRSDYINTIFEDQHQQLWVGTMNGLYKYNREIGYFENFHLSDKEESKVVRITQSDNGNIWLCTRKGLFLFDPIKKKTIKKYFSGNVTQVLEESHKIWIGTDRGVRILNKEGDDITFDFTTHFTDDLLNSKIIDLYKDDDGKIWLSSWKLYCFDPIEERIMDYKSEVWDFQENDTEIWMATTTGLHIYDKKSASLQKMDKIYSEGKEISDDFFTCLYRDIQGNLWVGSFRKGVFLYNVFNSKFDIISKDQGGYEMLDHNSVLDIYEKNNILWIATDGGGISLFDIHQKIEINDDKLSQFQDQAILSIREDTLLQKKWMTTWGRGLYLYDYGENKLTAITRNKNKKITLPENNIWLTFEDSKENVWVSVHEKGLCLLDKDTGEIVKQIVLEFNGVAYLSTFYIFEDSNQNLYFCTTQGLVVMDLKSDKVRYFSQEKKQKHPLPGYSVNCGYEDRKGRVWIGTNNGLALFDPIGGHFFKKGGNLGTLGPRVQAIEEDKEGNLWLAVNNQLVKYDITKEVTSIYTPDEMAFDGEFNIGASLQLDDGRMLFGSTNGIVVFNPDDLMSINYQSPLKIVSLELYNKKVTPMSKNSPLTKVIDRTEKFTLNDKQKVFSLVFSSLNYIETSQNKYMYKLEGFDKEWQKVGNKNSTTYTNLNPGVYTFHVKSATNNGKWKTVKPLVIEQLPPIWLALWAKLLYTVLFFIGIYSVYRFLLYREKLKQQIQIAKINRQKEKEIIKIREQFFTNISHELRTPLTLILTPLETLISQKTNSKNREIFKLMSDNAHRLLRLINQLMDFRKAESGLLQLNLQKGDIMKSILAIAHLYSFKAKQEQIQYQFHNFPNSLWVKYDNDKLEKILHNILSNAFKHTSTDGKIVLNVIVIEKSEFEVKLQIEVKDSGVGISSEHQKEIFNRYYVVKNNPGKGTGIGLTLTKEIVTLQKGHIEVKSEEGEGATFRITLPFQLTDSQSETNDVIVKGVANAIDENRTTRNSSITLPTLLIIDDNLEIQSYLRLELERDYSILTANDGIQGLKRAEKELPDLIISDVMMPKMDGMELCEKLKTNLETSHIPLLLLTAIHSETHQLEGLDQGADEYFTKPFNIKILKARVAYHLQLRKDLRSKFKNNIFIKPKEITTSNSDQEFLDKIYNVVFENIEHHEFNTASLCMKMGMSKTLLYNKLKTLTTCSTAEFIKSARMNKAAKLLINENIQVKEVAFCCGFLNQQQFYNTFMKFHGVAPSKFKEEHLKV